MDCTRPAPLPPVPNSYVGGIAPGPGIVSVVSVDGVIGGEVVKYTQDSGGQGNSAFLMGAQGGPLVAAGPTGLIAYLTRVGNDWCVMSPKSCADISPAESAMHWAGVLVDWLKMAPACAFKAGMTGSLYDNWGRPVDPYACPPGQYFDPNRGTCVAPPCPDGYARASTGLPCEPIATTNQATAGRTQQTAPTGVVPVQTTPTNYNNGPVITTQGGGSSPVASSATGGNTQTPFVSANLIPPSTLATAMIAQIGLSQATPAQWCALMGAMLGGFNCPNLALSAAAPITADVFLNALRQAESAQTAAPAITGGGFQTMSGPGTPVPAPTVNAGVVPAAPGVSARAGLSPVAIFMAAAIIVVILLAKRA